jgi:hypothetical protein
MTTRKYMAEGGINLYSSGACIIAPHLLHDEVKKNVL